ncbi:hypothetical protein GMOD_00006036 [Pyrenophora seminiperda CCB06]|uniref:Uncharacterized protein n=1 Tax=Pyrenophora seminiperda CCB06 TaxID=1302712 RepID=A0A3M7M443_9PLEO|nr:hypothetical protein GMOD_00006036 [Pyrenophora seminiperda CCB06]
MPEIDLVEPITGYAVSIYVDEIYNSYYHEILWCCSDNGLMSSLYYLQLDSKLIQRLRLKVLALHYGFACLQHYYYAEIPVTYFRVPSSVFLAACSSRSCLLRSTSTFQRKYPKDQLN